MTNDNQARVDVVHEQLLRKGGQTPGFINEFIPTEPLTINFGPMKGVATKGVGSALLLGSKTLLGTPSTGQMVYQALRVSITTGTPNIWFALTHSRRPGTFDTPFESAKGIDRVLSAYGIRQPIYSLLPGTLRVYALGPGSSLDLGKGSAGKFQGIGSNATGAVAISMDLYSA